MGVDPPAWLKMATAGAPPGPAATISSSAMLPVTLPMATFTAPLNPAKAVMEAMLVSVMEVALTVG